MPHDVSFIYYFSICVNENCACFRRDTYTVQMYAKQMKYTIGKEELLKIILIDNQLLCNQ